MVRADNGQCQWSDKVLVAISCLEAEPQCPRHPPTISSIQRKQAQMVRIVEKHATVRFTFLYVDSMNKCLPTGNIIAECGLDVCFGPSFQ